MVPGVHPLSQLAIAISQQDFFVDIRVSCSWNSFVQIEDICRLRLSQGSN